jgi:putative tricarboxylic transport membrane protein
MNREKAGALIFLLLSIAYGIGSLSIPLTFFSRNAAITPRTVPQFLSIAGVIISFLILVLPTTDPTGESSLGQTFSGLDWKKALFILGMVLIYGFAMKWIGFILSSILFLNGGFYLLGERRIKVMLLASIPVVVGLFFLMSYILGVYIAPGEIFYMIGILK